MLSFMFRYFEFIEPTMKGKLTEIKLNMTLAKTDKVETIYTELQGYTLAAHKYQLLRILRSIAQVCPEFIGSKEIDDISKLIETSNEESSKSGY